MFYSTIKSFFHFVHQQRRPFLFAKPHPSFAIVVKGMKTATRCYDTQGSKGLNFLYLKCTFSFNLTEILLIATE
jgi:hypothetical protein